MAEQSVTLALGESKVVSFEAIPQEARTYLVTVDGLSGSFVAIAGEIIFRSNHDPEITCCDGGVEASRGYYGVSWADLWSGPALNASAAGAHLSAGFGSGNNKDKWRYMWRSFLLFDTSSIAPDADIEAALEVYCDYKRNSFNLNPGWCIVRSNPLSNTDIVLADYNNLYTFPLSNILRYSDVACPGWNTFTLSAEAINKGGITKLGLREYDHDALNHPPVWEQSKATFIRCYSADQHKNDFSPRLIVWRR